MPCKRLHRLGWTFSIPKSAAVFSESDFFNTHFCYRQLRLNFLFTRDSGAGVTAYISLWASMRELLYYHELTRSFRIGCNSGANSALACKIIVAIFKPISSYLA
jgi:hypothetical protein